jgi:hypothetical protein
MPPNQISEKWNLECSKTKKKISSAEKSNPTNISYTSIDQNPSKLTQKTIITKVTL